MSIFATPRIPERGEELTKDDLLHALAVFRVTDYDPESSTKYGVTVTLRAHVTVVDGEQAGTIEPEFFAAGNLARQIGDALDVGQQAPGRIITGTSTNGRNWYGITWVTDEADLSAAEQVLNVRRDLPAGTPTPVAVLEESLGVQTRADLDSIKAKASAQAKQTAASELPPF